jgi:phosphopantothenate-cysteine ligase
LKSNVKNASPKVLITSGGTRELVDSARMITNRSTGKLGSLIADVFIARGAEVTYLYANHAIMPNFLPKESVQIKTTDQLFETITNLLQTNQYDAVIHLMAISDFSPIGYSDMNNYQNGNILPLTDAKMSSKLDGLVLFFKNTPKVINVIRDYQPQTVLVGFKLLADASDDKLVQAAKYIFETSGCDFVVANDQTQISASKNQHYALLLDQNLNYQKLQTKEEIAIEVAKKVCAKIKGEDLYD